MGPTGKSFRFVRALRCEAASARERMMFPSLGFQTGNSGPRSPGRVPFLPACPFESFESFETFESFE